MRVQDQNQWILRWVREECAGPRAGVQAERRLLRHLRCRVAPGKRPSVRVEVLGVVVEERS